MIKRTVKLSGGTSMPLVGLGTWPMDDAESAKVVKQAIDLGYRHVDTAENYENERGVGQGIRDSGIKRADMWVTTKFNRRWHGVELAAEGLQGNLERLGLDYVDLALIHWPNPDQDRYVEAWKGLITLREQGLARAIGTSNFKPAHIDRLIAETGVAPEVNQIELHPYFDRADERAYHAAHGIVTSGWSPLNRNLGYPDEPLVAELAAKYGVIWGQIVLAWGVAQGIVVIPKSANLARLAQNLDVLDIPLSADEIAALSTLRREGQKMLDSDVFGH